MAGSFIDRNEFEKSASEYRKKHFKDVKRYVKRIYNPIYYNTKPKYRRTLTKEESALYRKAIKRLYNSDIASKNDMFEELGIARMAET